MNTHSSRIRWASNIGEFQVVDTVSKLKPRAIQIANIVLLPPKANINMQIMSYSFEFR